MEPLVINVEILLKLVCVHVLIAVSEMLVSVVCTMPQLVVDDQQEIVKCEKLIDERKQQISK
jgi:hypothetical protein